MKTCKSCYIQKPLDEYFIDRKAKDGHKSDCKYCTRVRNQKWKKDNIEKVRENKKIYYHKNSEKIIQNLLKGKLPNPKKTFRDKMFEWYDRTVLEVMISKKMSGKEIFSIMFKNLSPEKILAFLGNESKFADEIKIMNIFPKSLFIIAGIKRLR